MLLASTASFGQSLQHLLGFLLVLLALTLLWLATLLIGRIFRIFSHEMAPVSAGSADGDPLLDENEPTEEEVAAVAAAVMAVVGRPSRIVSIRAGGQDWGMEGRREHFASHRLR